jgi:small nuclear ribonucleoprotein (snRNP)-like protein
MTITATQVLEMLSKAEKLGIHYDVYENALWYNIQFTVDWFADEYRDYSYERVAISKENETTFSGSYWGFDTWMNMLDEKLEEKEQEKIKEEKRKELIARLSDEEKELLNLK